MKDFTNLRVERLINGQGHYFFGYYDLMAFSQSGKYHLCHQVEFFDRMPKKYDSATIGIVDIESRKFSPLARTLAWNFQQGAMLQWNPSAPDREILFNSYEEGNYRGVVLDIQTGQRRVLELPIANIDPLGRYALSINFDRLYAYRPGYGYVHRPDPFAKYRHPRADGVFIIDMISGKIRMVLSLNEIWRLALESYRLQEAKLVINHVTLNPSGTRFLLLARTDQGTNKRRVTLALTSDLHGQEIHFLKNKSFASHYHWQDDKHLLIYGRHDAGKHLYLWRDDLGAKPQAINPDFFKADGHCSFSPDKQWILYDDSKPVNDQRSLYLYHVKTRRGGRIGRFHADPRIVRISPDLRCDLHPRWNASGIAISFDSIHEGKRNVYYIDLNEFITSWGESPIAKGNFNDLTVASDLG